MNTDIKKIVEELIEKITKDEKIKKNFLDNGKETIKKLINIDLDNEVIEEVVKAIKLKLKADDIKDVSDKASKVLGSLLKK